MARGRATVNTEETTELQTPTEPTPAVEAEPPALVWHPQSGTFRDPKLPWHESKLDPYRDPDEVWNPCARDGGKFEKRK